MKKILTCAALSMVLLSGCSFMKGNEGIVKVINTSYLDMKAILGDSYYAITKDSSIELHDNIIYTGIKITSDKAEFDVITYNKVRTNVTIRVEVDEEYVALGDSYTMTIGNITSQHSEAEEIDGKLYYIYTFLDVTGENPIKNAVTGGLLDFNLVTINIGPKDNKKFLDLYETPIYIVGNDDSVTDGETDDIQSDHFYLSSNAVTFTTKMVNVG